MLLLLVQVSFCEPTCRTCHCSHPAGKEQLSLSLWQDALEVELVDTSGSEDLFISKSLVQAGFASPPLNCG